MTKTRSQTGNITIKKEEKDCKYALDLNSIAMTTRNTIVKRKPSKSKYRPLPAQQVKVEEDTDTKSLLKSKSKLAKTPRISQEQIENLIKHIVGDKMTIPKASAKADMPYISGYRYYKRYLKDPDHKIPIPPSRQNYTQDQKNEFIGYIVNDKMTINEASKKARMHVITAGKYYHKYFDGQNPDITTPSHITVPKQYTQEQIKELISYIIDDKMSIAGASRKANISSTSAGVHYRQYLKENTMELPVSKYCKRYTQDEINEFIGYIVNDKMSIKAASKKANMNRNTGRKYYRQYRKDHNIEAPTRRSTQDQKSEFIGYIVDDKMTIKAASKKANILCGTGHRYYLPYVKDCNLDIRTRQYTLDKKYGLVDDEVTTRTASKRANKAYNIGKQISN